MKILDYLMKIEERIGLSPYQNGKLVRPDKMLKRMAVENCLMSAGISVYYNLTYDVWGSYIGIILLLYNIGRWCSLSRKSSSVYGL